MWKMMKRSARSGWRAAASLALGTVAASTPARAQVQPGTLEGVIVTTDSAVSPNTSVLLLRRYATSSATDSLTTRSGADGRFVLRGVAPGPYTVVVRRPGYTLSVTPVSVAASEVTRVTVQLNVATLESVQISARRDELPFVADREARGLGIVMYAEEIMQLPVYNTTDILQFYPRFSLGQRRRIIMVDGRPIRGSWEIPDKRDIAAMEAQRGFLGVNEPELWLPIGTSRTTGATVLLIWTKPYIAWLQRQAEDKGNRRP